MLQRKQQVLYRIGCIRRDVPGNRQEGIGRLDPSDRLNECRALWGKGGQAERPAKELVANQGHFFFRKAGIS
jgi:hypothetical protein